MPKISETIKKKFSNIIEPLLIPYVIYKLKKQTLQMKKIEDIVELSFNFEFCGITIRPSQVKEEILKLLKLLSRIRPKRILEIGTYRGGTLFLFCHVADPTARIISIDLPHGKFGGGYPWWKIPLLKSFARCSQKIYLIRDDSHKKEVLEKVKKILRDQKSDFLFIDGDRTYKGIKKDFNMYGKLVKGIIAIHDIVPRVEGISDAPKFWSKIRKHYKTKEIVKSWKQGGYGIGVIYKSESYESHKK